MNAKRVLCIDDEPHVLSALDRNLRNGRRSRCCGKTATLPSSFLTCACPK